MQNEIVLLVSQMVLHPWESVSGSNTSGNLVCLFMLYGHLFIAACMPLEVQSMLLAGSPQQAWILDQNNVAQCHT